MTPETRELIVQLCYLIATVLFIFSLKWMNTPKTARRGVMAGVGAMALGVGGTIVNPVVAVSSLPWIALAVIIGGLIGVPLSKVPLTAVPQRTALSHAFGGFAAGLVGTAKFYLWLHEGGEMLTTFRVFAITAEVLLGFMTFTGSLMAAGKLQEIIPTRPITYRGQLIVNFLILGGALACAVGLIANPTGLAFLFPLLILLSLAFGVMLIIPIGGADMPTVIALLNSYAGLSAVAMGFVLDNKLLIIAGALDGSSGLILSIVMCKAMNRSFTNVLFGAFGSVQAATAEDSGKTVKSATPSDAAEIMEQADSVVIVPGYGMAVAQAQHRVRELYDLLAEADIPYDDLVEMEDINSDMAQVDVVLVIGANDVVNPAAKSNPKSPIYGMPIIEADRARTVLAIKRSMNPGFAGIENELYTLDKTLMVFGDAKAVVGDMAKSLAGESGMH